MADGHRTHLRVEIPWSTLSKVILAVALLWVWPRLAWIVLLLLIAIIVAAGLAPTVERLERHRWPRWVAATTVVLTVVGTIVGFFALTAASLMDQARNLGSRLGTLQHEVLQRLPQPIADLMAQYGINADAETVGPYVRALGRGVLEAAAAFVLASILVLYLLIEAKQIYQWVRGFAPARLRPRVDRTAREARQAAHSFVVGNVITSCCAGLYFFVWLTVLGVPGALILATLGFIFDFIPVLGFYLSCAPAMAMAATESTTLMLTMIPVYMSYDLIENYLIGPRVYGDRLALSKVAVLLAFAVGAALGGVVGAVLALPIASIYPTIERLWLRGPFGEDVVTEHQRVQRGA
jgi:predicted PurR-regulated permease PerM